MYLVYLTSYLDKSSVDFYLHINRYDNCLIIDDIDTLKDEMYVESYDIIVFDYNCDFGLIETLRQFEGMYNSIKVFVSDISIGKAYLPITEDIWVLPKQLNLMTYLWQHEVFSLGNILNAIEVNKEVFNVEDFSEIDTENELLEFKTVIEDIGESDLVSIQLLKIVKLQTNDLEETIRNQQFMIEDLTNTIEKLKENKENSDSELEDDIVEESFDTEEVELVNLRKLLRRNNRNTEIIETSSESIEINTEIIDASSENIEIDVENNEEIEEQATVEETSGEMDTAIIETSSENIEINTETNEEVNEEQSIDDLLNTLIAQYNNVNNEETSIENNVNNEETFIENNEETSIENNDELIIEDNTQSDNVKIVYEEYDENKVEEYDEVQEYQKYITNETEITVETDETMQDTLNKSEASTEMFKGTLVSESINKIH